jgi:hypothetical protein
MAEFHVLAKHVYTNVEVPRGVLVGGMDPHDDGAVVVDIDISRTRISKSKMMEQHAKIQGLGCFRSVDILAFLRTEESSSTKFHLPEMRCTIEKANVSASAFTGINVSAKSKSE